MKKSILLTGLICLATLLSHSQSIDHRNWKAYLAAPINDTVTFHINSDSSFIANSNGEVVIRINCMIAAQTLSIVNQEADEHGCPGQKGTYTINFKDNGFTLSLINDECEGRAHALAGVLWKDTAKN